MIFNSLYPFKKTAIYKEDFPIWLLNIYSSFTGSFRYLGFLDYIFVLPGLIKLLYNPYSNSSPQKFLHRFSNFLSIFKHITAFILTIGLLPLHYLCHKYVLLKGDKLKKHIQEIEVLPVDEARLEELGYEKNIYSFANGTHSNRSFCAINKKKLYDKFYGDNSHNRIKLKDHPQRDKFLEDNTQHYMLKLILLKDENEHVLYDEKIIGVFPAQASIAIGSYEYEAVLPERASPALLIIPSREKKAEIQSIEKFDAFFFSLGWDTSRPLKEAIQQYVQQDDPFKKIEQQRTAERRTILFALQEAAARAVDQTGMADINTSIDPLITTITQFSGAGKLNNEDVAFGKKIKTSGIFPQPTTPWVTHSKDKEAKRERLSNDVYVRLS